MTLRKKQLALSNYPYYKHSFNYTLDSLQHLGATAAGDSFPRQAHPPEPFEKPFCHHTK